MQLQKVAFSFAFIILISLISVIEAKDVKVFKRGKVSLIDETQFKNPYEYEFTDDQDETDLDNAYDEKVPYLPKYILHKNGIDQGYTRVPIVTRKGENTWSTPRPTTQRGEEYKTWGTPKILPITKPTPSHPEIARTTPVPKTTFIAKFSLPPPKAEKQPAKKPEVKATTSSTEEIPITKLKKFFTHQPTTTSTEATTEAPETTTFLTKKKQLFTRRPTTISSSTEKSQEVTKSRERKPTTTSKSVETITEEFTTDFTRKSFKKPKTTTVSEEETAATSTKKKQQFTRRPSTTSASSEEPISSTSKKQFTRRPTSKSTEAASTESSTDAPTTTRRKFTRRPTSTESTTEATTEASTTRRKFTRKPKPSSTESASSESSTEASTRKKFTRRPTSTTSASSEEHPFKTKEFFTKRPTTTSSASTEQISTNDATTAKRKFTRKPKPTTTTEEPTTEETTMLPLKDRLRPMLTTREPTPTMPRRFRVFTNPSPAEAPTEELNPQQEIENQRKLKEKLSFGAGFNQEFSSKHKYAQRFGIQRIIPSYATTPQGSIIVTPVTASPVVVANAGHGLEQTVKSNAIILQAQKNPFFLPSNVTSNPGLFSSSTSSTSAPQVLHRWSSSWSSWSSWDANGQKITGSKKTFSTSDTSEATTPTPSQSRLNQFTRTRTEQPSNASSSSSRPSSSSRVPIKPHVIHHGRHRYRGPTYNCRVLTPNEDGRPSPNNDSTCPLKFPGFPADDSCRCRYDVEARDEHGCATGFLYTCKRVNRT
uniref:Uncharacterized protein n=1 Tax=Panagrolaimus sp. ES5 TaxID=591445 RepID=A0AC34FC18_9BILA